MLGCIVYRAATPKVVPNKWWEAKILPLKVPTPCKCKCFDCGGDWRNHFPVVVPEGYVPQWWDEQPDAVVSFYIVYESYHLVGGTTSRCTST